MITLMNENNRGLFGPGGIMDGFKPSEPYGQEISDAITRLTDDNAPEESIQMQYDVLPGTEVEEDNTFEINKFQLVRTEFFYNLREPSVTLADYKIGFSTACVRKIPSVDYVQLLINSETKTLAVRPCEEHELHSLRWCNRKNGVKTPRQMTGKIFYMKVCSLMNWNPEHRYRALGKLIEANGQYLFVFDLTSAEFYEKTTKDGASKNGTRKPIFPEEWRDQFGVPFEDHQKSLQVNILDNYLVYGLRDKAHQGSVHQTATQEALTGEINDGGEQPWQNR